jgi:hypothetical protein
MALPPRGYCRGCAKAPATHCPAMTGKAHTSRPGLLWALWAWMPARWSGYCSPCELFTPDTEIVLKALLRQRSALKSIAIKYVAVWERPARGKPCYSPVSSVNPGADSLSAVLSARQDRPRNLGKPRTPFALRHKMRQVRELRNETRDIGHAHAVCEVLEHRLVIA